MRRGRKAAIQNQTCSGSLYLLSPPRARQIPRGFASLLDRTPRSPSPQPRAGRAVRRGPSPGPGNPDGQVWRRPEPSRFRSCGEGASAAPWGPRQAGVRGARGERCAAPLRREARSLPRPQEAWPPPPLRGLRLRRRRHSRSAPAAALLRPGAGTARRTSSTAPPPARRTEIGRAHV